MEGGSEKEALESVISTASQMKMTLELRAAEAALA